LDACFSRIGYTGPCEPTLETLRNIHERFALTFTFENLSIHGLEHLEKLEPGEPVVSVDPAIVEEKLLRLKKQI
jgi:arylamine N-acetyltransferase